MFGAGWSRVVLLGTLAFFAFLPSVPMPVVDCPCDHSREGTLAERVCSLCGTAEEARDPVYFLKDISPHKPHRHLALPRQHSAGFQSTADLPRTLRAELWRGAVTRAEELYPGGWGVAQNSHFFRTQCHAHLHIGPLSPEVEDVGGTLYRSFEKFPNVGPAQGIWLHPKDGGYCVHLDRDLAEVVLVR